jgi:hypothetical protein
MAEQLDGAGRLLVIGVHHRTKAARIVQAQHAFDCRYKDAVSEFNKAPI